MTKVRVHGQLAEHLGCSEWEFEIEAPRDIVRAIDANTDGKLIPYLYTSAELGIEYRFVIDGKDHESVEELLVSRNMETIDLIPVPAGSAGLWQTIAGVVLIVVGVIIGVVAGWTGWGGLLAGGLISLGLSLLVSGISAMFFGPNVPKQPKDRGEEGDPSYLFNGAVNTTRQGGPVPLLYGRMMVGSQLISAGVRTAAIMDPELGDGPEMDESEVVANALSGTIFRFKAAKAQDDDPEEDE